MGDQPRWAAPEVKCGDLASLAGVPRLLAEILSDRPASWLDSRHRTDGFSPREVLGHFIVNEEENWMPRARMILSFGESQTFLPFDINGESTVSRAQTMDELLRRFAELRAANLVELEGLELTVSDLCRTGQHPKFGAVTLDQLLSTWVAHDLYHLGQIFKDFSASFVQAVGPWQAFLNLPEFN
jgi:hypothetical protein